MKSDENSFDRNSVIFSLPSIRPSFAFGARIVGYCGNSFGAVNDRAANSATTRCDSPLRLKTECGFIGARWALLCYRFSTSRASQPFRERFRYILFAKSGGRCPEVESSPIWA